jgi:hypothetical protein
MEGRRTILSTVEQVLSCPRYILAGTSEHPRSTDVECKNAVPQVVPSLVLSLAFEPDIAT